MAHSVIYSKAGVVQQCAKIRIHSQRNSTEMKNECIACITDAAIVGAIVLCPLCHCKSPSEFYFIHKSSMHHLFRDKYVSVLCLLESFRLIFVVALRRCISSIFFCASFFPLVFPFIEMISDCSKLPINLINGCRSALAHCT